MEGRRYFWVKNHDGILDIARNQDDWWYFFGDEYPIRSLEQGYYIVAEAFPPEPE